MPALLLIGLPYHPSLGLTSKIPSFLGFGSDRAENSAFAGLGKLLDLAFWLLGMSPQG
jgi:hypothetical protein